MYIHRADGYIPNVLHFHGMNMQELSGTFNTIINNHVVKNNYDKTRLQIVSTWTDDNKCSVLYQCKKTSIPIVNCVPKEYDKTQKWYMPNKIKFFINILENTKEELTLFVDGYDVLFTHLDDIIERFESQPYRILFGPSCNNFPNMQIDKIYGRQNFGIYRYFNAGCVIGYTKDLLEFYKKVLNYINIENPIQSEQYVMRFAFAEYSNDKTQTYIGIDWKCSIFQSMGQMLSNFTNDDVILQTRPTALKDNTKILLIGENINKLALNPIQIVKQVEYIQLSNQLNTQFIEYLINKNQPTIIVLSASYNMLKEIDTQIINELTNIAKLEEIRIYAIIQDNIEKSFKFYANWKDNFADILLLDVYKRIKELN